ncbi:MAG: hypothetical protein IPK27_12865 [Rhodanobacteraceae bacterium]|nr:hypothetical protein [Rhodanobacteraceae bacterium]
MRSIRRSLRAVAANALLSAFLLAGPALTPALAAGSTHPGAPPALASYLDAQGRLQLPAGYSGTLDPGGLRMQTAADGTPMFVPRDAPSATDKVFGLSRGCNADPDAIAVMPSGIVYLGGNFTQCDDVRSATMVAYDPRTRRFARMGDGIGLSSSVGFNVSEVKALAVAGTDLYVGGLFTYAGGVPVKNIARWDGSAWHALGAGVDFRVRALAVSGNSLYVGGDLAPVMQWDGQAWRALGTRANGSVNALAARAGEVYAGGSFTEIGGRPARGVARWDGSAWHSLGEGTDEYVYSLAFLGSDLIRGGSSVARWDGNIWSTLASLTSVGDTPRAMALAVVGDDLYLVGSFYSAGATAAPNIARYRNGIWSALADGLDRQANSLAVAGNLVYVGGSFSYAGDVAAPRAAVFNGVGWSPLGTDVPPGIDGSVNALLLDGDRLIVAGAFSASGGLPANNISVWNGAFWDPNQFGPGVGDELASVYELANYAGQLCAGGRFETAGGRPARNVACWDGREWSALGDGPNGWVYAMIEHAGELYVGGYFTSAGGVAASNVARWNGNRWAPLGGAAGDGVNVGVSAIVVHQGDIHVAGAFTQAGGGPAVGVARWRDDTWTALGAGLVSAQPGDITINALVSDGGHLYAGGRYNLLFGTSSAAYIARWDGSAWSYLADGSRRHPNGGVGSMVLLDDGLYVNGGFLAADGQPVNGLAFWDGTAWRAIPGPNTVMVADGPTLIAGVQALRESPLASLQSRAAGGANAISTEIAVSRTRARIVFSSYASNLVEGDNDTLNDVFVRDPLSGAMSRVSDAAASLSGATTEAYSEPAVSSDGAVVAFTGSAGQVYAVANGAARVVSSSAAGALGNGTSGAPQVPGLGARVVFASQASNLLLQADGNGPVSDIYAKDLANGTVTLLSTGPGGEPANGGSYGPWASDDGLAVAFFTSATNLADAGANGNPGFFRQAVLLRGGERPARLYLSRNLVTGELGNGDTYDVRITPDGRFGVFASVASNLVEDDTNDASDVFRFEVADGRLVRLERVSTSIHGRQANGGSYRPSISDDGQFVAFESGANNLVPIDRGGYVDVFVKWMANGELQRLRSNGNGTSPVLSGDGLTVAFISAGQRSLGDVYAVDLRERGPGYYTGPLDEPSVSQLALPAPIPANSSCPHGFFVTQAGDGPGAGLTSGTFGMEVLLDEPGTRTLAGGLNFGGLIDSGQVGFAGFNIRNERNEPQRVEVRLAGSPASSSSGSLPVRVRIARRTATSSDTVFEATPTISLDTPFVGSADVAPGFYEVTVGALSGTVGGAAEGQFFFGLSTHYLDRPGGGFDGGAVVGGYHAPHPFGGVSGFAAFCLATPHSASVRLLSQPSYGLAGARDLRLRLIETQGREVFVVPAD